MSKKRKGLLQRILMLMLVVCMVCGNGITALADEAVASTMRLTKTEGTVSVTNKNGRDMGTMADMKLFNGYHLTTAQKSYAWMNLDDHKLVKLDAVSEAEIQKKGKDLEVLLNSGNLLFNVTESLKADETLNVRTSTMVTGIRGTCGWVKVLDASRTQVHILEGQVECYVMDPVSGQYKSVTLRSGETAEFVVYDQTRVGDKCDILINRFSEKDIPGFVAVELMDNSDLRDRITGSMNIDMNWIFGNGPTILDQDQKNVEQKFVPLNEAVKQQDHKVTKDPLFGNDDDDDDNDGDGSSGGDSSTTPPSDPSDPNPEKPTEPEENLTEKTLTVTEAETDDQLNYYLSMSSMEKVTIIPSDSDDTLDIKTTTTVASGQTLLLENVDLMIEDAVELRINGELTVPYDVVNFGTITNTSLNSFVIQGMLTNEEGATIENTGKIDAANGMLNHGAIISSGRLIGDMTVSRLGSLDLLADDNYGTLEGTLTVEGRPDQSGYVTLYQNMPTSLVMNGGTVEFAGANADALDITNGRVIVSNESTINTVNITESTGSITVNTGGTVGTLTAVGGTISVDGGTVKELLTPDADSNSGTTTATAAVSVALNSGIIETATMETGSLTVSGGTVTTATVNNQITVAGGEVITLNADGARVRVTDGVLQTVNLNATEIEANRVFYMTAGEIGTLNVAENSGYEPDIAGGTVGDAHVEAGTFNVRGGTIEYLGASVDTVLKISGGNIGREIAGNPIGIDLNGAVYSNGTETISITGARGTMVIEGGKVKYAALTDFDEQADGDVVTTISGDSIDTLEQYSGNLVINGGTLGSVLLQAATGTMTDGSITNGLTVKSEDVNTEPLFTVSGGTISAGEASAAITVEASVPVNGFTENDYGYKVGNVAIYGGTIDGQEKTAINVINGEVVVDMFDDSTTVIKGSDPGNIFAVPSGADEELRIWFGEINENNVTPEEKRYTDEAYLFFNQGTDEFSLKRMAENFEEAVTTLSGGEYLVMSRSYSLTSYDEYYLYLNPEFSSDSGEAAILDLNGYDLTIDRQVVFGYEENGADDNSDIYGLKICDSKGSGLLTLYRMDNYGTLTLDGVCYESEGYAIYNRAELNIHDSNMYGQDTPVFVNYGTTNITGASILESETLYGSGGDYGTLSTIDIKDGTVNLIGDEDNQIKVLCNGDTFSRAIYLYDGYYSEVPSNPRLFIEYSTVSATEGTAIHAGVNSMVTVGVGSKIESVNELGTIVCASRITNYDEYWVEIETTYLSPKVYLDAGEIVNNGDGYAIAWDTNVEDVAYDEEGKQNIPTFDVWTFVETGIEVENEVISLFISDPEIVTMKMKIEAESALYERCYQNDPANTQEGASGIAIQSRHLLMPGYTVMKDGDYWTMQYVPAVSSLAHYLFNAPQASLGFEGIATASNATATDSNASGLPEGTAKAAIPMATVLFGLMYAVPRLIPNDRKRERKER